MQTMHTLSNETFNRAGTAFIANYNKFCRTMKSYNALENDISDRTAELDAALDILLSDGFQFLIPRPDLAHIQKVFSETLSEEFQLPKDPNVNCNFTLSSREIPTKAADALVAHFFNMRNQLRSAPNEYALVLAQTISVVPEFTVNFNLGKEVGYVRVTLKGDRTTDAMQKAYALAIDTDDAIILANAKIERRQLEEDTYNDLQTISTYGCENVVITNAMYNVLLPYITE